MKKIFNHFLSLLFVVISLAGCTGTGGGSAGENQTAATPAARVEPKVGKETLLLMKELADAGDYVNSTRFPSIIMATLVNEGLPGKNLLIDLRTPEKYRAGHIKGALNKKFEELPEYFEKGIKPFEYEKIVLVCEDGQMSGYTASLLRLAGYGNVFSMRWGMSGWNMKYADEGWLSGVSGEFEERLDTVTAHKPPVGAMPPLNTGLITGAEILDGRLKLLFAAGTSAVLISAAEVFDNPDGYFIINIDRKDKYESGHLPGAVRYKPEGTLGFPGEMATIPFDKPVVVYCGTGHNSAFATAYLRLLGYDAKTLKYGNNSFMYNRMMSGQATLSWQPFTTADVNDFQVTR